MGSTIDRISTNRRTLLKTAATLGAGIVSGAGAHPASAAPRRTAPAVHVRTQSVAIPDGMALVTSPRLPLFDVGPDEAGQLLAGAIPDWSAVGSPIRSTIQPVAVGAPPAGMTPVESYADYEAFVAGLAKRPGAIALVPVGQVDFRVNVLAVGGADPLRQPASGAEAVISIGVVGDIVPGRNVDNKMRAYDDYTHPFRKIADHLSSFDMTFANLEGNLSDSLPHPTDAHTFTFVSSPKMVDGLKMSGIDAVSLGNNHSTWNSEGWGTQGLTDTIAALEAGGMPFFGGGRDLNEARAPFTTTVGGKRIAIIGVDGVTANDDDHSPATVEFSVKGQDGYVGATDARPGTNPYSVAQFTADIKSLAGQYEIVIPYIHFGAEYIMIPPRWATDGAKAAIDAGAAMVVSNHPHVIQGMEVYAGKPIVYSVGNFIFDQMFSVQVRSGMVLEIVLRGSKVVGLRPRGVEIEDFNQPRLMSGGEHASLMDRFWNSTDRIIARG